jgi:hypothetical protein
MHSTNVRQIKAALVEQAFHGTTQVSCPWGRVVAVSRWQGQLRVMIRGFVEYVLLCRDSGSCSTKMSRASTSASDKGDTSSNAVGNGLNSLLPKSTGQGM